MDDELDRREDRELELIRGQMEQTRASLGDKLEALESQVMDTVQTATEGVATAVEGVKATVETVSETVSSVTETFNISKHVENNPFGSVACSAGVGFAAALLFGGGNGHHERQAATEPAPPAPPAPAPTPAPPARATLDPRSLPLEWSPGHEEDKPSAIGGLLQTAGTGLAGLAVGALGGVLRNLISSHLPKEMHEQLHGFVQNITESLGLPASANPVPDPEPESAAETRRDDGAERHSDETRAATPPPRQQPRNGSRPRAATR